MTFTSLDIIFHRQSLVQLCSYCMNSAHTHTHHTPHPTHAHTPHTHINTHTHTHTTHTHTHYTHTPQHHTHTHTPHTHTLHTHTRTHTTHTRTHTHHTRTHTNLDQPKEAVLGLNKSVLRIRDLFTGECIGQKGFNVITTLRKVSVYIYYLSGASYYNKTNLTCIFQYLHAIFREDASHKVKEERDILLTITRRKANWIGHIWRRN